MACVIADLTKHDIDVALPISEHLPFDLIAIDRTRGLVKLSVKYRVMKKTGTVTVLTRSSWNDRHGTHNRHHYPGDYDAVAIYCPDTDQCYYLLSTEFAPSGRTLRIRSPSNNQTAGIHMARLFTDPIRIFGAVAPFPEQPADHRASPFSVVTSLSEDNSGEDCTLFAVRPGQESNPQSAV